MKRSEANRLIRSARAFLAKVEAHAATPEEWAVTDFRLGEIDKWGAVVLRGLSGYLVYAREGMVWPAHCHHTAVLIRCEAGVMGIQVWRGHPASTTGDPLILRTDGQPQEVTSGDFLALEPGDQVEIPAGAYMELSSASPESVLLWTLHKAERPTPQSFAREEAAWEPQVVEDEWPLTALIWDSAAPS